MKRKTKKRWSNKEIAFLRENYRGLVNKEITKKINRSRIAIRHKAIRLGLKKDRTIPLKKLPPLAKKPTKILAWLVGYLLGDGYLTTNYTIGMKTKDNDLKEFYIKKFKEWSKFKQEEFVINREEGEYNDKKKGKVYTCKKKWIVRVCSKEAWQFFKQFSGKPLCSLKFFPREYWKFILKGLWDAEGYISLNKGGCNIGFSNSNENISTLYKKICNSLGYYPREYIHNDEIKIVLHRMKDVTDFVNIIGITIWRKRSKSRNRIMKIKRKIKEIEKRIKIFYKINKLRETNMGRKEIWERINNGQIPKSTFDKWLYCYRKPRGYVRI